ncbi:hypothetical protein HBI81_212070 [Parastagonospora nodorum]|nr:hypothetical protein HBH51_246780 [Parastagonospora nodorum]KAH3990882.1 hypothetical protein HBI10_242890 [Parastagonospora nodorum]KAH4022651.1 hypothetical protein HBI09_172370 [Parastagonospora nodorum]KAH4070750.1 hypothetical protein HBH50_088540 [Parastagonospora nodorum]KAH4077046.1 hypothetical protein HBH46_248110 [Parastagonospora nodorum]
MDRPQSRLQASPWELVLFFHDAHSGLYWLLYHVAQRWLHSEPSLVASVFVRPRASQHCNPRTMVTWQIGFQPPTLPFHPLPSYPTPSLPFTGASAALPDDHASRCLKCPSRSGPRACFRKALRSRTPGAPQIEALGTASCGHPRIVEYATQALGTTPSRGTACRGAASSSTSSFNRQHASFRGCARGCVQRAAPCHHRSARSAPYSLSCFGWSQSVRGGGELFPSLPSAPLPSSLGIYHHARGRRLAPRPGEPPEVDCASTTCAANSRQPSPAHLHQRADSAQTLRVSSRLFASGKRSCCLPCNSSHADHGVCIRPTRSSLPFFRAPLRLQDPYLAPAALCY